MANTSIFSYKKSIDDYLISLLNEKKTTLGMINSWGTESIKRLLPYITAGKSVRGCLALFSYTMFTKNTDARIALPIAAGIELIHAGALIHDDIMDHDEKRRHMKAMHKQYDQFSSNNTFGESMAINLGDLCFFLAFEQFALVGPNVVSLAAKEFATVTIAQQFDVASSYTSHQSSEKEILSLYKTKTARYTFSLPLMMGAMVANADNKTIQTLESLGESMGILFQIRDDQLGIIGNPDKTGKPIGSDKANHKQILKNTEKFKKQYYESALQNIQGLHVEKNHTQSLIDLVTFCNKREA